MGEQYALRPAEIISFLGAEMEQFSPSFDALSMTPCTLAVLQIARRGLLSLDIPSMPLDAAYTLLNNALNR